MNHSSKSTPSNPPEMSSVDDLRPAGGAAKYVFLALAALAAVVLVMLLRQQDRGPRAGVGTRHALVGKPLTRIELAPCVNTDQPLTTGDLKDKVVLINYWGTWCPPCREEFPHIVRLRGKFAGNDRFAFLSVSCSASGEDNPAQLAPDTAEYLKSLGAEFPVYCDPDGKSRIPLAMAIRTDSFFYPTTVVADRAGVIRGAWTGYLQGEERDVEALVAELLTAGD